jgi:hypothetical protein
MVFGAALVAGITTFATAQAVVPVQYRYDDRRAFDDGYKQGRWDATHRHRFDPNDNNWRGDDRRTFREGYERGFREVGGYREGYGYNGGGYDLRSARELGYQDGLNDGAYDLRSGHSYRPTHGDSYKHADRGYNPGYGNKNYYKDAYREAYLNGYQQGFNSLVYQRR